MTSFIRRMNQKEHDRRNQHIADLIMALATGFVLGMFAWGYAHHCLDERDHIIQSLSTPEAQQVLNNP